MHIIDRYLVRQFVQTFLICFLSLMGLYVVIEVSTNMDQFTRCGQAAGGVLSFIARYYAFRWIQVFDLTSSLLALVSAMFTVSWIQRHNEMTALMAAGVSRFRVVLPIICAVAGVSLLGVANRELLVPRYRSEFIRRPQDPAGDRPQDVRSCRDNRTDVELTGKSTYAGEKRIEEPSFLLMRVPTLRVYGNRLTADNAYYLPPKGDRPGGYLFKGVHEPKNLDTRASLYVDGEAILITPRDAPGWLKPDECFFRSDVEFEQLLSDARAFEELASTAQLIAALRNPSLDYGAKERVAIHHRIVRPLLDMTLLFLGLPLVVGRESRNVFLAMGVCMLVTVAFTAADMTLQQMGEASYLVSPALAAWGPLILFVPLAVGLSESLRK